MSNDRIGHFWAIGHKSGTQNVSSRVEIPKPTGLTGNRRSDTLVNATERTPGPTTPTLPMTTALNVARYLIRLAGTDPESEPMTAIRLQKLLYYCQGWHLAWYGRPLFADHLEAWEHGPVVPPVYGVFKSCGNGPLVDTGEDDGLRPDERAAIKQVWDYYRRYSAAGLRSMTHDEPPWRSHYNPDPRGRSTKEIPVDELATYFGDEYQRKTGDRPGSWAEPPEAGIPLEQLRQEMGW